MTDYDQFQSSVIQELLKTSEIGDNDFNVLFENIKLNYTATINSLDDRTLATIYQKSHPVGISNSIFAIRYGLNPTNFNSWRNKKFLSSLGEKGDLWLLF